MSRKRAEIKSKKSYKKDYSKIILVAIIILLIGSLSIAAVYLPSDKNNESEKQDNGSNGSYDKWLFAMDTDNVQYKYQASAIPTLVIIDKNGDIIYYYQGSTSKEQLLPYVNSAIQGTSESIAESIDFTVSTFNGEKFTLSDHKGEVIILDIMGVGCYPCIIQMPQLQEIKKEKGDQITILSVDTYYSGENKQDVIDTYGEYILL